MPGVMAGGDEIGPDAVGIVEQLAELQPVVADDAGIGGAAGGVFVHEIVDDPAELVLEIEGIKRDVEPIGHAAGVAGVHGGAAAFFMLGPLDDGEHGSARRLGEGS